MENNKVSFTIDIEHAKELLVLVEVASRRTESGTALNTDYQILRCVLLDGIEKVYLK